VFERRALFFTTPEGFATFRRRLLTPAKTSIWKPDVICDAELPGPWSEYATVWRFALQPPSDGHLHGGADYFFL
jgi:hypothetical protein